MSSTPRDPLTIALEALRRVLTHLKASTDIEVRNAVYLSPAESLRRNADAIEKQDADIAFAREAIKAIEQADLRVRHEGAGEFGVFPPKGQMFHSPPKASLEQASSGTTVSDEDLIKICEAYDPGEHMHLECLSDDESHYYHGYRQAERDKSSNMSAENVSDELTTAYMLGVAQQREVSLKKLEEEFEKLWPSEEACRDHALRFYNSPESQTGFLTGVRWLKNHMRAKIEGGK
jgi:hypothetical protein